MTPGNDRDEDEAVGDGMNREPGRSSQAGMPAEFVDQGPNLPGDDQPPTVTEQARRNEEGEAPPSPS